MSGYVRCACCNLPISVTEDDVGLTVTCPRTRKLVPVKAADVRGQTPSSTKPAAASPAPASASPSRPTPPSHRTGQTVPGPASAVPPKVASRRTEQLPTPKRSRNWRAVGVCLLVALTLGGAGVFWVRAFRPERPRPEEARNTNPTVPALGDPARAVVPPSSVTPSPVPPLGSPVGTVTPPVKPPSGALPVGPPPTPARPLPESLSQVAATYRREVVRVNHPRNCVMCHAPSLHESDLVRGAVPDPSQALPPPTTPAYYRGGGQFVSADITYLRQDFSVVQPVLNSGNWSSHQRYDYFVAVRKVDVPPATAPAADSPYRKAVGFALKELSGRDPDRDPDWLAAQKPTAAPLPDARLAEVAQYVSLQTDPKALIALKAKEFAQPLLATPKGELDLAVKGMQELYGVTATRTALIAYLVPLTRNGDAESKAKATRFLAVAAGDTPDADVPAALGAAVNAASPPVPDSRFPSEAGHGAGPASPPKDARGLSIHALAKRIDPRKSEELDKELLGIREISLDTDGASAAADLVTLARKRKKSGQPYHGTAVACEGRPDLAGLPFKIGFDAALTKEKAEALHTLSKNLRETAQACMRRGDPRPNTDDLYEALMPTEWEGRVRPGFRDHDPKQWATPEAVPCVQQILAAESRDVRRLACELLKRIDTPESTEALVRWAVFECDPNLRAAAVEALRPRTRHNVAQQLLVYARYPWPRAAEHAAEALVALNCKWCVPQLAAMYDLPDPDAPFKVIAPAPKVVLMPPPPPRSVVAVRLAESIKASKDPDAAVRRTAAVALGAYLTDADKALRRDASKALAEMGAEAEPAAAALDKAAKDGDDEVRGFARRALDNLNAIAEAAKIRAEVERVAKGLNAAEPEERVKSLHKIGDFGVAANCVGEQVIEAMQSKVGAIQTTAAETLEKINPKVHPHVVAILRGKNKREAILALGELGSEATITVPLLLYCNDKTFFWGGGNPKAGNFYEDLFPVLVKIAPNDKRLAASVMGCVSAPNTRQDRTLRDRRLAGIAQLSVIDAKTADKVAALVAALDDGEAIVQVIRSLGEYGADATPALPALKKLKTASGNATRDAAILAIAKIESASLSP